MILGVIAVVFSVVFMSTLYYISRAIVGANYPKFWGGLNMIYSFLDKKGITLDAVLNNREFLICEDSYFEQILTMRELIELFLNYCEES